jgi:uroporphyrinogen III methyltransferase / synthase
MKGKRVVVTRPQRVADGGEADGGDGDLSAQLQQLGAETIIVPAIQLVLAQDLAPMHHALDRFDSYDWVVFTSPSAVAFYCAVVDSRNDSLSCHDIKIAAVGSATQRALQAHGVQVNVVPEKFLGTEIVTVLGNVEGKRILLPRSGQGGRELPNALRELGATVDDIALYAPVASEIGEDARKMLAAGVDVVTFASGSAVRAFAEALQGDARFTGFWSKVVVACIGPTTADVARSIGLPVHVMAAEHSASGLVAALADHFHTGA